MIFEKEAIKIFFKPVFILAFFMFFMSSLISNAQEERDEEKEFFFSYERFYLKANVFENAPRDGRIQNDIYKFLDNFSSGIYAISEKNYKKAKDKLLAARSIWPEYFGTDFLLARVCEDVGDYPLAARFFRSYLNKLKAYNDNEFRISSQLIRSITPYGIETTEFAYDMINERVKGHGIDINKVRPVYSIPPFLMFFAGMLFLGIGYVTVVFKLLPYIKRVNHIKNPPEGFWVCKKCGTDNTLLQKECEKCRRPRD